MNQPNSPLLNTKKAPRDSNIELFRIITMLLIIAGHYVINSGLAAADGPLYSDPWSFRSLTLFIFSGWGKTGINCFVLITGYFMCKSHITGKKFAKLVFEVMFYRMVIYSIFFITGRAPLTPKTLFQAVMPVLSVSQNFSGTYIMFFLFIPFLNILVQHMTEIQHRRLILWCLATYTAFETLPWLSVDMNYVSWYMVLYFIASFVRLYPKKIFDNKKFWAWATVISLAVAILAIVFGLWQGEQVGKQMAHSYVTDSNTLTALMVGFSSFMLFKNMRIKPSRFINALASTTFGVLLIHSNSKYMRQWLWKDTLNNVHAAQQPWWWAHALLSVVGIFLVCAGIDLLRQRFVEAPLFRLWDRIAEKRKAKTEE